MTTKSTAKPTTKSKSSALNTIKKQQENWRVEKGSRVFTHDLFMLQPSKMLKDLGFDPADPKIVELEHQHVYHSINSQGIPQVKSTQIGGHYHRVEITGYEENGRPIMKCTSGPLETKYVRRRGMTVKEEAPVMIAGEVDSHQHEMVYIFSDEIKPHKKINPEAMKVIQSEAEKARPVDGAY